MIYKIHHTFKPVMLIPLLAIKSNVDWIFDKNKKMVVTSDNIMAKVIEERVIHFLSEDMDNIVKSTYKTDVLTFGRKWYQSININTMEFVFLRLEKYEGRYEDN